MWFNPTTSPVYTAPFFTPNLKQVSAAPAATLTTASKTLQPTPTAIPNPNDGGIQAIKSFLFFCVLLALAKFASWIGYGIVNWFCSLFTSETKQSETTNDKATIESLEAKQSYTADHKELTEPLETTYTEPYVKKGTTSKISSTLFFILRATIITSILLVLIRQFLTVPTTITEDLLEIHDKVEEAQYFCKDAWKSELCQDKKSMRSNGFKWFIQGPRHCTALRECQAMPTWKLGRLRTLLEDFNISLGQNAILLSMALGILFAGIWSEGKRNVANKPCKTKKSVTFEN